MAKQKEQIALTFEELKALEPGDFILINLEKQIKRFYIIGSIPYIEKSYSVFLKMKAYNLSNNDMTELHFDEKNWTEWLGYNVYNIGSKNKK